jgi:D-sedoheptulose 7-phosphate isomerase
LGRVKHGASIIRDMLEQRIEQHFIDSADLKYQAAQVLSKPIASAIAAILASVTSGGKVLACGNGGSAADAQHFAAEFVGRFERERPELGAIALTTDSSILTAVANDYSFEQIFAKQVRALGQAGDVLLAITTSGNSANVLAAIEAAHEREMTVVALTGRGGGKMNQALRETDVHICVAHDRTARVQEVHLLTIHCICDGVDVQLLGDQGNQE